MNGDSGYCDKHRKVEQKRVDDHRGSAASRGYDSTWRKNRIWYLRQYPLCERCEAQGLVVVAILVHHRDHDTQNKTAENLESLCVACHEDEHKETRFGRPGGS